MNDFLVSLIGLSILTPFLILFTNELINDYKSKDYSLVIIILMPLIYGYGMALALFYYLIRFLICY